MPESEFSATRIVAAWTDPVGRALLTAAERAAMPPNPAGTVELPELPGDEGDRTGA